MQKSKPNPNPKPKPQARDSLVALACRRQAKAGSAVALFTDGESVLRLILPILVAGPLYMLGSISLGVLTQSTQVFGQWIACFF